MGKHMGYPQMRFCAVAERYAAEESSLSYAESSSYTGDP